MEGKEIEMIMRFNTWDSLLALVSQPFHEPLFYRAPLDRFPKCVKVVKIFKNNKIKIKPIGSPFGGFTVDSGHLDRFHIEI